MDTPLDDAGNEIKRLQRCINDLVSVLALPAIWAGSEPGRVADTMCDALLGLLRLDLVYACVLDPERDGPLEMIRAARPIAASPQEIGALCSRALKDESQGSPPRIANPAGEGSLAIVVLPLGFEGESGCLVAGSARDDFPDQTELLLLGVAANQAASGLREAWLLSRERRIASELDRRVAQRTAELAAANEELTKEVAERKLAEERLRLEERELKRSQAVLAETQRISSTGSFWKRMATGEIIWSDEVYRIFELNAAYPITLEQILDRVHPEDVPSFGEMLGRQQQGVDYDHDYRLLMPDGSIKYLHVAARATRDPDGQVEYVAAVQDVTRRHRNEEALAKTRSELARVARISSLGAVTASIAHEVNQPLAGIITNAGTCLRMLSADPPNVEGARETARRTIRDGNRASEVITRLRALFTKKNAEVEPIDLNEATREVVALSLSELQRNRAILRQELADDLPKVAGDRVQLQQVILNLLLNASDAMSRIDDRPRELLIRTEREPEDRVRLTVRDCGVGFAAQDAERLFEAFYTTKSGGMGIGLSVSRSIIENHRGRLWAVPNDGPGATFAFSIPWQGGTAGGLGADWISAVKARGAARGSGHGQA